MRVNYLKNNELKTLNLSKTNIFMDIQVVERQHSQKY